MKFANLPSPHAPGKGSLESDEALIKYYRDSRNLGLSSGLLNLSDSPFLKFCGRHDKALDLVSGSWSFRYEEVVGDTGYVRNRKKYKEIVIGHFPDVKVSEAQKRAELFRDLVEKGVDPVEYRKDHAAELFPRNSRMHLELTLGLSAASMLAPISDSAPEANPAQPVTDTPAERQSIPMISSAAESQAPVVTVEIYSARLILDRLIKLIKEGKPVPSIEINTAQNVLDSLDQSLGFSI